MSKKSKGVDYAKPDSYWWQWIKGEAPSTQSPQNQALQQEQLGMGQLGALQLPSGPSGYYNQKNLVSKAPLNLPKPKLSALCPICEHELKRKSDEDLLYCDNMKCEFPYVISKLKLAQYLDPADERTHVGTINEMFGIDYADTIVGDGRPSMFAPAIEEEPEPVSTIGNEHVLFVYRSGDREEGSVAFGQYEVMKSTTNYVAGTLVKRFVRDGSFEHRADGRVLPRFIER